jgi:hypothetical protein
MPNVPQADEQPQQLPGTPADTLIPRMQRPARALIGWMAADQAERVLAAADPTQITEEHRQRAAAARAAVAARPDAAPEPVVHDEVPDQLAGHVAWLQAHPMSAAQFEAGARVALVDLRTIRSIQPNVFSDHAEERVAHVEANDLAAIAAVALPVPEAEIQLPLQFDPNRAIWMVSSPNPNLRIVSEFHGNVGPGVVGLGFAVTITPSFIQVGEYQGRFILRDGYHRAYGFIRRGITTVPAFVRSYPTYDELAIPQGMLSQDAFLGERPPTLADYDDDDVASDVSLPATQKMIVVHGMELTPSG